jgi:dihydrofolate reductase
MMGDGELIASFLDAGEIDEFDIHVIPVFIGKGIPLVARATGRAASITLIQEVSGWSRSITLRGRAVAWPMP